MKNILITGGAGYIGSHIAELLLNKNNNIFIIDNLARGSKKLLNKRVFFIKQNIVNYEKVKKILIQNKIDSIIHLAALTDVQDSEKNKLKYFKNNILGTQKLIEATEDSYVKNIIYSSSAGIYGNSKSPVNENSKIKPINNYALTKLKGEEIIKKYSKKFKYNFCILRYFNVCGASPSGKIGIINNKNKSLFKIIASQALKKNPMVNIFGNNFKTKDGTCIRDYIHVSDLASIHNLMLKYINKKNKSYTLNCGYGKGYSVLEVIKKFEKIIKKKIKIKIKKKRKGEIIVSYSNISKLQKLIKWNPKFNNLNKMVKSSFAWEKKLLKMEK